MLKQAVKDTVFFYGHKHISAKHPTTFEITKEDYLTPKGDCIIGINSSKSCYDLLPEVKNSLKNDNVEVVLTIVVDKEIFKVFAKGSSKLILFDKKSIVVRKSDYICPRTLAIKSTASAKDFPRNLIKLLQKRDSEGMMIIEVLPLF
ncbi:MAG: DUF371 domain-containing protein [Nitrososphaeria archaeon]